MARAHTNQPPQRLSFIQKNKKWRKDNLDYADKYSFYNNESVRKSLKNKVTKKYVSGIQFSEFDSNSKIKLEDFIKYAYTNTK